MNALDIFHEPGDVVEIRTIGHVTGSGYFKNFDDAMREAMKHDGRENVYFVLNRINEACYHRENKDAVIAKALSTSDGDVTERRWIFIDFDPVRPGKVSATDEEKKLAEEVMKKAGAFLREKGFSAPVVADSGNGWHLMYRIAMPNTPETKTIIEQFLKVLDMLFSTDAVKVDTAVFNAARITKLYGTMAVKGANTESRPHRRSCITFTPKTMTVTDTGRVKAICEMMPKPVKRMEGSVEFDVDDFIRRNGLSILKSGTFGDGTKHVLETCPFDDAHGKDSAIIVMRSGAIVFKCLHNGCANNGWKELREKYEPLSERPQKKEYSPPQNPQQKVQKPSVIIPKVIDEKTEEILKRAENLCNVKQLNREHIKTFSTGIRTLDQQVELVFGKLVVISGVNGSGKSTFLGQLMLESLQQNFNVFAYSGELMDNEFQYWIDLQAAGDENVIQKTSKKGKTYYEIEPNAKRKIHEWYADRFFLYKNNESMQFGEIMNVVETFREHRGCDVIFLDNFLTIDIGDLDDKELKAQTIFINSIARYAKEKQVLIFLVIHPKKIYKGICTKGDVLGSGNLTNAIDYLLLIHRMNESWQTSLKDRPFSKITKNLLLDCDNILEVSKDRWTGKEGTNIRLEFHEGSKRLLDMEDDTSKYHRYGWDTGKPLQKEEEMSW